MAKVVLPEVYQKQSNFSNVKIALAWMASLMEGVNKSDETMNYETGLEMVCCSLRNLDSAQVHEVRESLSNIVK